MAAGPAASEVTPPSSDGILRWKTAPLSENRGGIQTGLASPLCATSSTTPRSTITVTGPAPATTTVHSANSPDRNPSALVTDRSGPWTTSWNLSTLTPGTYRIRSTAQDSNRISLLTCVLQPVAVLSDFTVEYKPWTHTFSDFFGNGTIGIDTEDGVVGVDLNGRRSPNSTEVRFYSVPGTDTIALPGNPAACASDPGLCLPAASIECPAGSTTCTPRLALVTASGSDYKIVGFVDLETGAMIVYATAGGSHRLLLSLGTELDAENRALLQALAAAAAEQGIDLATLLATKVRVRAGDTEVSLSLLNALQVDKTPPGAPGSVQIVSDFTAQAGIILNIYSALSTPGCASNAGDSDPNTPAPDRYTHAAAVGYDVERSDLLPDVPRIGPLGALVGGPIYHITGDFTGALANLVNSSTAVIGVDTAADEPNGYPIWIEPFLSTPAHVTVPRTMDFVGTATWSASETGLGAACLTVDFMLGTGIALYNNPLPIGLGTVPIWDPTSPEVAALIDQIDAAIQGAADQVAADPTVAGLLQQVLDTLP